MLGFSPLAADTLGDAGGRVYVALTGLGATASLGTIVTVPQNRVSLTGLSATGAVGTGSAVRTRVSFTITGVQGTGRVGTVNRTLISVSGVQGVGQVGAISQVFVWSSIVPNQTPNYSTIVP